MLHIYDSQRREKVPFEPLDPDGVKVGMYYCGPTVYDSVHLGHARAAIVPDMVRRYLEYSGYVVRYVANFTDVDDKIIHRALAENRVWREITAIYTEEWQRLGFAVGNRPADVHPRATDHIPEMIDLVDRLVEAGNAYVADDGDVYFDTESFDAYGGLSGRKLEEQRAGASGRMSDERMAVKKNDADFILWKLAKNDDEELRERADEIPGWDSPWGRGRPGWHLECSALSRQYLGMPFDIHGGGRDLIFPHHENEKAQNDCAYCAELEGGASVRYWIHNGFITLDARDESDLADDHTEGDQVKMSKSLGNVHWLKDMIWPDGPYDPMAVRMLMLQSHYRSPIRFSQNALDQAEARVGRIYDAVERLRRGLDADAMPGDAPSEAARTAVDEATADFRRAMDDDFNTPGALAAIDGLIKTAKSYADAPQADRAHLAEGVVRLCRVLGLRAERSGAPAAAGDDPAVQGALDLLGELRAGAREAKDWELADRIRDQLVEAGWELRDRPDGSTEIVRRS